MIVLLLVKPLNLIKELLLAALFGTTATMDLYVASLVVPLLAVGALGGLFQATVVPIYNTFDRRGERDAWFSSLVTGFGAGLAAAGILLYASVGLLFPVFASGGLASHQRTFMVLSLFSFGTILPLGVAALYRSYLESAFDFKTPVVLQGVIALAVIGSTMAVKIAGVYAVAAGNCIGSVLYAVFMAAAAARAGFRYRPRLDLRSQPVRRVLALMAPLVLSAAFTHVNVAVDITMAAWLKVGSVSSLSYAEKIMIAVRSFFVFSLSTAAMSHFSRDIADGRFDNLDRSIRHAVRFSAVFLVPLSLFCMVMAVPLVRVIFERGAFTPESTLMTGRALACFAAGLFPVSLVFIVPRVFYALQENRTVMVISGVGAVANVALNFLFMRIFGAPGIALSTSCVYVLSAAVLMFQLSRRSPQIDVASYLRDTVPIALAALIAVAVMMAIYHVELLTDPAANLLCASGIFGAVYLAALAVLAREDVRLLAGSLRSLWNKQGRQ